MLTFNIKLFYRLKAKKHTNKISFIINMLRFYVFKNHCFLHNNFAAKVNKAENAKKLDMWYNLSDKFKYIRIQNATVSTSK